MLTNVEAMWLLRGLRPCYKTIADFRKDNSTAFQKAFKEINRFLRNEGLFNKEIVAIDGTKIRCQNSMKNNYNERKVKRHLEYIEGKIENYLQQMDETDKAEEKAEIEEKINTQKQRKKAYKPSSLPDRRTLPANTRIM